MLKEDDVDPEVPIAWALGNVASDPHCIIDPIQPFPAFLSL